MTTVRKVASQTSIPLVSLVSRLPQPTTGGNVGGLLTRCESVQSINCANCHDQDRTSLGIVHPKRVLDLTIEDADREWKPDWQALFQQLRLFGASPKPLTKIPFKFSYVFECEDSEKPHKAMIEDWELGVLFLKEVDRLGSDEQAAESVRAKFLNELCAPDRDTRFFVGYDFSVQLLGRAWSVLASEGAPNGPRAVSQRFNPYSTYKPSVVAWLGEIPADWETKRLKYIAQVNPSKSELSGARGDTEVSFLPMELVGNGTLTLEKTKLLGEIGSGFTYFRDSDVLVAKITPSFENGKGAIARGLTNGIGFGTTELHVIRTKDATEPEYLYYLTLTRPFRAIGAALMYGTAGQKRVPDSFVRDFVAPVPSVREQRAIAAFLDRETAKIDKLIAKNERLIELLQEKRIALISRAVTKGLDPTAPMKDSGVEWLGKIPAHWRVERLKSLFDSLDSRRVPLSSEERATLSKEYPYYGASGIIDYVEQYLFDEPLILVAEDGANLFSRSSPLAFVARGKYWVNNHAHILKPHDGLIEFWSYLLASIIYDPWITGSAQPKLTGDNLGSIALPSPPTQERKTIAAYLDHETSNVDALIARVQELIERLREYRTALISAAVTGKIDVRESG